MISKASSVKIEKTTKFIGILRILVSVLIFGDLVYTLISSVWLMNLGVNQFHYQILPYWFNLISFAGYTIFIIYNFTQGIRELKSSSLARRKNIIRWLILFLSLFFIITSIGSHYYQLNPKHSFSTVNLLFLINYTILLIVIILSVQDLRYIVKNYKGK